MPLFLYGGATVREGIAHRKGPTLKEFTQAMEFLKTDNKRVDGIKDLGEEIKPLGNTFVVIWRGRYRI